nr:hypothetical protein [Saprospiraceae bacterium]
MNTNKNLETLIKIRHLADGLKNNWKQLITSQEQTKLMLDEAQSIISLYATDQGKQKFKLDFDKLMELKDAVSDKLKSFKNLIEMNSHENSGQLYEAFIKDTDTIHSIFARIRQYDYNCFVEMSSTEWSDMWLIIQSNLNSIKGLAQGAYIKIKMYESFNNQEIDELTKEIVKYIPTSFDLEDAIQYKREYLEALR